MMILPVLGVSERGTRDHRECQQGHSYLSLPSDIQAILSYFAGFSATFS
jgi:hypothetical protein